MAKAEPAADHAIGRRDGIVRSTIGARQGDRNGPDVFNGIYEQLLKQVRDRLEREGVTTHLGFNPAEVPWTTDVQAGEPAGGVQSTPVGQATYVDDDAKMLEDATPQGLIGKVVTTLNVIHDVLSSHGLALNMAPDKTATMMALFGNGARQAYKATRAPGGDLRIPTAAGECTVVHSYRHLGCTLQQSGRCMLDARAKVGKANSA